MNDQINKYQNHRPLKPGCKTVDGKLYAFIVNLIVVWRFRNGNRLVMQMLPIWVPHLTFLDGLPLPNYYCTISSNFYLPSYGVNLTHFRNILSNLFSTTIRRTKTLMHEDIMTFCVYLLEFQNYLARKKCYGNNKCVTLFVSIGMNLTHWWVKAVFSIFPC